MADLRVTLACDHYDLIWPLKDGTVKPDGIDLRILTLGQERHERMMRSGEYDACEIGVSHYLMAHLKEMPFKAIPVFIRRMFLHRFIYCHAGAQIHSLQDLRGKRVGIIRRSNMLALWLRGHLRHEFGIESEQITWVTSLGDVVEGSSSGKSQYQAVSPSESLEGLLVAGKIDAMVVPQVIEPYRQRVPQVRRLFEDYKKEEIDYYRKTRIFPIMHLLIVREDVLKKEPSVAVKLLVAFREAKRQWDEYLRIPPRTALAWASSLWEEERDILGEDPWAYNVKDNMHTVQTIIRYAFEDGLIGTEPDVKDLFAESTFDI
ncbi:MAG: ABC transporter substrate-binding protein [Candidatus Binatia bacterium]